MLTCELKTSPKRLELFSNDNVENPSPVMSQGCSPCYVTLKYNDDGTELWRWHSGIQSCNDFFGKGITIDRAPYSSKGEINSPSQEYCFETVERAADTFSKDKQSFFSDPPSQAPLFFTMSSRQEIWAHVFWMLAGLPMSQSSGSLVLLISTARCSSRTRLRSRITSDPSIQSSPVQSIPLVALE